MSLKGYDPVAYFTMGRPTIGNAKYQAAFEDVRYHFVSSKHLEIFRGEPDKYAPRFTGLCAMGLGAKGYKVEANPENWVIHKGHLYLTHRSFGPPIFRKGPDRWVDAAGKHVRILKDAPIIDFNIPDGVNPFTVNIKTGRLTDRSDPRAFVEYFKSGTEPRLGRREIEIPRDYLNNDEF